MGGAPWLAEGVGRPGGTAVQAMGAHAAGGIEVACVMQVRLGHLIHCDNGKCSTIEEMHRQVSGQKPLLASAVRIRQRTHQPYRPSFCTRCTRPALVLQSRSFGWFELVEESQATAKRCSLQPPDTMPRFLCLLALAALLLAAPARSQQSNGASTASDGSSAPIQELPPFSRVEACVPFNVLVQPSSSGQGPAYGLQVEAETQAANAIQGTVQDDTLQLQTGSFTTTQPIKVREGQGNLYVQQSAARTLVQDGRCCSAGVIRVIRVPARLPPPPPQVVVYLPASQLAALDLLGFGGNVYVNEGSFALLLHSFFTGGSGLPVTGTSLQLGPPSAPAGIVTLPAPTAVRFTFSSAACPAAAIPCRLQPQHLCPARRQRLGQRLPVQHDRRQRQRADRQVHRRRSPQLLPRTKTTAPPCSTRSLPPPLRAPYQVHLMLPLSHVPCDFPAAPVRWC
jgi:hypothetical protein